jgi:two-component system, chemotaxis family, chemotaxis protein CheY
MSAKRVKEAEAEMASILLVEDDSDVRTLLRHALEMAGHVVTEAWNGRDGLEQYTRIPCEVVVTDILMPVMDGMALIRELKRLDAGVRIIAITGGIGVLDFLDDAGTLGAQRTLRKPFCLYELVDAVREVLLPPTERMME